MKRTYILLLIGVALIASRSMSVGAESKKEKSHQRIALCVGIGEYAKAPKLRWAERDAVAMANALRQNGYKVICLTRNDATRQRVRSALKHAPTVVYFAGHYRGSALQLKDGAISIMDVAANTRFMLLDCCLAGRDLEDTGGTIVFAAGKGYAFEAGSNGLFTKHMLAWLKHPPTQHKPGMVDYVCRQVARETGNWQRPVVGRL